MHITNLLILAACDFAAAQKVQHTRTGTCAVAAARATAQSESPTSNVPGKLFDRILTVYLETTSFGNATADRTSRTCKFVARTDSSSKQIVKL